MVQKFILPFVAALTLAGCATHQSDYAGRNNLEYARDECLRLAQSNGYSDVAVDGVERDGSAEWKVRLRMRVEGKDKTERCEYNARTDRAHLS